MKVDEVGVGCLIPGHLGIYAAQALCREAIRLGWKPTPVALADMEDNGEWITEACNDAEKWLNTVLEDGVAYWSDGEFFVQRTEKCPRCGEIRFANEERIFGEATECPEHEQWY